MLFIYAVWWDKPLDIEEPEVIQIQGGQDKMTRLLAKMCVNSSIDNTAISVDPRLGRIRGEAKIFFSARFDRKSGVGHIYYRIGGWRGRFQSYLRVVCLCVYMLPVLFHRFAF